MGSARRSKTWGGMGAFLVVWCIGFAQWVVAAEQTGKINTV